MSSYTNFAVFITITQIERYQYRYLSVQDQILCPFYLLVLSSGHSFLWWLGFSAVEATDGESWPRHSGESRLKWRWSPIGFPLKRKIGRSNAPCIRKVLSRLELLLFFVYFFFFLHKSLGCPYY